LAKSCGEKGASNFDLAYFGIEKSFAIFLKINSER
jgi:hypothetical protein